MAINFPDSPSNGDTHTANGVVYTYNSTSTLWDTISSGGGGSSVTVSDTAPTSPSDGDQWFNSTDGSLLVYYNDGSSSQWVVVSGPAGADGTNGADGASGSPTSYANLAAFPSSGNTAGDMGFATDTKAVYVWDGVAWQRMSIGNQLGPRFTTSPSASTILPTDGSTTTITGVATDDDGFPITYDWDAYSGSTLYNASSLPPQLTGVSESNGVFTLTPATSEANAGDFSFRVKASDGVLSTPAISNVVLSFVTYVTVDTQQANSSNRIEPTTNGTIDWYNTNSGSSTATLYLPYGGTNIAPLGKRYIEFKYISTTTTTYGRRAMIGVATRYYAEQYSSVVGYSGTATNVAYYYGYNGNKYPGGTAQGLTSVVIGDVVQLAYDTDAEKVWLGKNNTWSTLSGDPSVGGAGISVDATAGGVTGYSLILATGTASSYTSVWEAGKQSGSDTYAYPIPTGFSQF